MDLPSSINIYLSLNVSVITIIILFKYSLHVKPVHLHAQANRSIYIYSEDPEIGPPMGLTESGPILEAVRFVKPVNFEWRDTSRSVYRYALLRVDIKVDY